MFWIHFKKTFPYKNYYKIGGGDLITGRIQRLKLYYLNRFITNCYLTSGYVHDQLSWARNKAALCNQIALGIVLLQEACTPCQGPT